MRFRSAATLLAFACSLGFSCSPGFACLVLSPLAHAQADYIVRQQERNKLCNAASAVTVDHDGGVTIEKVTLSGKWGHHEATFYLPEKEIADGGVLFSHSAIHADSGASVDFHPFALVLAHAGAVVMLPERTMTWPTTNGMMNREGAVVLCAEHWLVDHAKVFNDGEGTVKPVNDKNIVVREGFAYIGPRLCDPLIEDACEFQSPLGMDDCGLTKYCRTSAVWTPVSETEGGDNTNHLLSSGWLREAEWIQKHLGLAAITAPAVATAHD